MNYLIKLKRDILDALYTQCKAQANNDTNKIDYLQDKYDLNGRI